MNDDARSHEEIIDESSSLTDESLTLSGVGLDQKVYCINFTQEEFQAISTDANYNQKESKKRAEVRPYKIFKPKEWQSVVLRKLRDVSRIECGFLFKHSRINRDKIAFIEGI